MRAAALGDALGERRVAAHLTAAWIWGAVSDPGDPLEFAIRLGNAKTFTHQGDAVVHEYRFAEGEVCTLGPFAVTSPVRTLYDLLRADIFEAQHRFACRMLLAHATSGRAQFIAEMPSTRRPHSGRVLRRLAGL